VIIHQIGAPTGMGPGVAAQELSGTIDNPNAGPAYVSFTASIAGVVNPSTGTPVVGCDETDFTINLPDVVVAQALPGNTTAWSGPSIEFVNKPGVDQDACKGAKVNIDYTVS
jgi:hypothetical protein